MEKTYILIRFLDIAFSVYQYDVKYKYSGFLYIIFSIKKPVTFCALGKGVILANLNNIKGPEFTGKALYIFIKYNDLAIYS